jgi:hypothetical protein
MRRGVLLKRWVVLVLIEGRRFAAYWMFRVTFGGDYGMPLARLFTRLGLTAITPRPTFAIQLLPDDVPGISAL